MNNEAANNVDAELNRIDAALSEITTEWAGKTYTRKELKEAFELVENQTNWKFPVDKTLTFKLSGFTFEGPSPLATIEAAVVFFTGSVPKFETKELTSQSMTVRVVAAGYYATVGA